MMQEDRVIDVVGVGIGPFNLSVAALLQPLKELQSRFFEREDEFQWHPGLLFPEATIQVSFLKDLVTLADPTSPYSFLSFLFSNKRLYRFINADFARVSRREFNQYFRWVAGSLPNLEFGRTVEAIDYDRNSLVVDVGGARVRARNVVLGTGLSPLIPACAQPYLGPTVFHASRYLKQAIRPAGQRIAVVGGGQTGAEVIAHMLADSAALPQEVIWITRRPNFLPLDDSPFVNELFTPAYSDYFFNLGMAERARLLHEQKLASDGISTDLLAKLYRQLYELEFVEARGRLCRLLHGRELAHMGSSVDGWVLETRERLTNQTELIHADIVVLCTGFSYKLPSCLEPLAGRIHWEKEQFTVRQDYSIVWDGPDSLNIYVQNAAKASRGIADPNLSLMAWRSAMIVNSLVGRCVYDINDASSVFDWAGIEIAARQGGFFR